MYQKRDTDISKISIFPLAIRYGTIYRYRIDISIFQIYRSSTVRHQTVSVTWHCYLGATKAARLV